MSGVICKTRTCRRTGGCWENTLVMGREMQIELESTRAYISLFSQTGCWVTTSIIDMFRRWFLHLPLDRRFIPRFSRIYIGMSPSQLPWQMKSGRLPTRNFRLLTGRGNIPMSTSRAAVLVPQMIANFLHLRGIFFFCDVGPFLMDSTQWIHHLRGEDVALIFFQSSQVCICFCFSTYTQKISNWPPLTWKYLLHNNGTCSYLAFTLLFLTQKIGFKTWLFTYNPKLVNPLPSNIGCDVVRFTIAAIPVFLDLSYPYAPCTEYLP